MARGSPLISDRLVDGACVATAMALAVLVSGCDGTFTVDGLDGTFRFDFDLPETVVERETQEVGLDGVTSVQVRTFNGEIAVTIDAALAQAVVEIVRSATGVNRDAALERLDQIGFQATVVDGVLQIAATPPGESSASRRSAAELHVTLPGGFPLDLETGNGAVMVDGNSGAVRARSDNGRITVTDNAGDVDAQTDNGRITVTDVVGNVTADTRNGNITVRATLPAGGNLFAETSNGALDLRVPAATAAALDLSTRLGAVRVDLSAFTVTGLQIEPKSVQATLNGGGGTIRGRTDNGSIEFDSL